MIFLCLTWRSLIGFAAECTAKEAFQHAGPNIVFASGSPFRDVDLGVASEPLDVETWLFLHVISLVDQL